MPFYEFKCTKCDNRFTKLCSMGENGENLNCPECNTAGPSRIMSGFSSPGVKQAGGNTTGGSCGGCTASSCSGCGH